MNKILSVALIYLMASPAIAKPVETTLKDYAYDFASVGYEISFIANTSYMSSKLAANDYFNVSSDGYTLKARPDRLSRSGRKSFVDYFNENCKHSYGAKKNCKIKISGEVELDDGYKMLFLAKKIDFLNEAGDVTKAFE